PAAVLRTFGRGAHRGKGRRRASARRRRLDRVARHGERSDDRGGFVYRLLGISWTLDRANAEDGLRRMDTLVTMRSGRRRAFREGGSDYAIYTCNSARGRLAMAYSIAASYR